jgi:hypothetical protein
MWLGVICGVFVVSRPTRVLSLGMLALRGSSPHSLPASSSDGLPPITQMRPVQRQILFGRDITIISVSLLALIVILRRLYTPSPTRSRNTNLYKLVSFQVSKLEAWPESYRGFDNGAEV